MQTNPHYIQLLLYINQASRKPNKALFQLTRDEWESIRFQMESSQKGMSSQFVMTYPGRRPNSDGQITKDKEQEIIGQLVTGKLLYQERIL